jgi:DNA-binding MarR family transcriptional regulator
MRPSFGFVLRAVATERPTVSRLAELLGIGKQGASRLADDMVSLGYLERTDDPADRRRTHLRLSATGERGRTRALAESHANRSGHHMASKAACFPRRPRARLHSPDRRRRDPLPRVAGQ